MSLPVSQQRALDRIERILRADDSRLEALFATFSGLTQHEPMPWIENVRAGRRQQLKCAAVIPIVFAVLAGLLTLSLLIPAGRACGVAAGRSPAAGRTAQCLPVRPIRRSAG
jgi:hypothetical protein